MKKSFKKLGFVSLATSSVLLGSMNATDLQTYAALQKPSHVLVIMLKRIAATVALHTPPKMKHQLHQPHQLKKMTQAAVAIKTNTPLQAAHQLHQPHQLKKMTQAAVAIKTNTPLQAAHQLHQPHQLKKMTQAAVAIKTNTPLQAAHQLHQPHQLKRSQNTPLVHQPQALAAWQASYLKTPLRLIILRA